MSGIIHDSEQTRVSLGGVRRFTGELRLSGTEQSPPSGRGARENRGYCGKIRLFGHFGAGNFGNESTLQAMLWHLRRLAPGADISCICSVPTKVTEQYGVSAVSIRPIATEYQKSQSRVARWARKLVVGIPRELYRWLKCVLTLHDTDALIVAGTGLLTDAFGIRGWGPYSTFKWSLVAKLCGCRLMFVSVGAGPLEHRFGRLFIKSALFLADFRSYRDRDTLDYLKRIGFHPNGDEVYPDLAFSLPHGSCDHIAAKSHKPVVGLGLMAYEGMYGIEKTTRADYDVYLKTLAQFAEWLSARGYEIRLIISDVMDLPVTLAFRSMITTQPLLLEDKRLSAQCVTCPDEVLSDLATTDFVVATRFHSVLLALLLDKPSIAICFHHKCFSLMELMGMAEYSQHINHLTFGRLSEQFSELEAHSQSLRESIRRNSEQCRRELAEQYGRIVKELAAFSKRGQVKV